jgi:hypothetical protein
MKINKKLWYGWVAGSFLTFAGLEAVAIADKHPNDSLSATWWRLRTKLPVRLLIFPPLTWVVYHLFVPWDKRTGGMDDAAVVTAGVALALAAKYTDRNGL